MARASWSRPTLASMSAYSTCVETSASGATTSSRAIAKPASSWPEATSALASSIFAGTQYGASSVALRALSSASA